MQTRRCDGVRRRDMLRVGSLAFLGMTLPEWQQLRASAAGAKSCIFIWLDGGPSHLDTFDLKPDAPIEIRGNFKPIPTAVPGIHICEHLPKIARHMKKLAVVRTVTSAIGEHDQAGIYLNTGYKPTPALVYPGYGAVVSKLKGDGEAIPPYIAAPHARPYMGPGYLPGSFGPFNVGDDLRKHTLKVRDMDFPIGMSEERMSRRRSMVEKLDSFQRAVEESAASRDRGSYFEQAYRLVTAPAAKNAFDLSQESEATRRRYGSKIGQSCLLARRLVEGGAKFVTVVDVGWDTHLKIDYNLTYGFPGKLPGLDAALSSLLEDLDDRGLLDTTLVVVMGEFGRTPKINPRGGRDHWPGANSMLFAGGGVLGGQVIGRTDARGELPAENPVSPEDLARTLYTLLGVNPDQTFETSDGRPIQLVHGGRVIRELTTG